MSNCVVWKIRRAARVLTRLYDEALAPCDLTSTQLGTLDALSDMGASTLTALAEAGGHERSATWRGLQPLIRRGLVRQAPGAERPARYEISEAGAALLETALGYWKVVQDRVVAELGDNVDHLSATVDQLDAMDRQPRPAAA